MNARGLLDNILVNSSQIVYITISITFSDNISISKFMNIFFCLLASPRFNISNCFKLIDILQLTFYNSSLLFNFFI